MTKQHAKLSPSSSARWITCPGSVRVIEEVFPDGPPEETSVYAEEGTLAHEVAEAEAGKRLGVGHGGPTWRPEHDEDMFHYAQFYADVLENLTDQAVLTKPLVLLEQRVDTGIDGVWGTADAILVVDGRLYVVDYKYGRGVQVASGENTQLMLYALGALRYIQEVFGDSLGSLDEITMTIVQPRTNTPVSEHTITREELEDWAKNVAIPAAELAANGDGPVVASEDGCRWCPAAGACAVRAQYVTDADFGTPANAMTPEQLAENLAKLPEIEKWCKQVRDHAMHVLYVQGEKVPGYKTVWRDGSRKIVDTEAAIKQLMAKGFRKRDIARTSLQTLSVLDKLTGGREQLAETLGDLLTTGEGKPTIVPEDDKRPTFTKADMASQEFADKTQEGA